MALLKEDIGQLVDEGNWKKIIDIHNNYDPKPEDFYDKFSDEELESYKKYIDIINFYKKKAETTILSFSYIGYFMEGHLNNLRGNVLLGIIKENIDDFDEDDEDDNIFDVKKLKNDYSFLKKSYEKHPRIITEIFNKQDLRLHLQEKLKDSKWYDNAESYIELSKIGCYMHLSFDSEKCKKQIDLFPKIKYSIEMCLEILLLLKDELCDYEKHRSGGKWVYLEEKYDPKSYGLRKQFTNHIKKYLVTDLKLYESEEYKKNKKFQWVNL